MTPVVKLRLRPHTNQGGLAFGLGEANDAKDSINSSPRMKSCVTKVTFHFNRAFEPPTGRAVGDPAAVLPWCHSRSFTAGAIARCLRAMLTLAPSDGERDNYCGAA